MPTRIIVIVLIVVGAIGLPFAFWLLSPLFTSQTVQEEFPIAASGELPQGEFPLAAMAELPEGMPEAEAEQMMREAAAAPPVMFDEYPPDDMAMPDDYTRMDISVEVVKSGVFRNADSFHRGSGLASIYRAPDGRHLLRLTDFSVTNGPQLHVLLVPHRDPMSRADVEGNLDLGELKGNMGNQNYFLPDGANPADYRSAVIYCKPFRVIFSVAPMS